MWRSLRRRVALAFLLSYEWVLGRFGRTPDYGVLCLELAGELAEDGRDGRFPLWLRRPPKDYLALVATLRWAREDERLSAVMIRCGHIGASWARIQGLRRSLLALRAAGKKVWVHLESAGLAEYYLATAADRISVTPAGSLEIVGISSESTFLLDALESLGVRADIVHVGAYKAAGEMFTRREMSAAHREMMESLIGDLYGQVVEDVAVARDLDVGAVRRMFDGGPFLAREALEHGLIDAVEYGDETDSALETELDGAARDGAARDGAARIEEGDYTKRRSRALRRQLLRAAPHRVAVVHVNGTINMEEGATAPLSRGRGASSAGLKKCLAEIREREEIEAVVVRVASPGGSGLASDLIWRELTRTAQNKPLFVSFGDVAASGGYYVAVAGRKVFAEPGTITGSIGVIAGKANLKGLYDKLGVRKEMVSRGRHAALYSDYVPLGESERERIQTEARKFYDDFVAKVAAGRKMTTEETEAVAQGRVWTGRQACDRGLVDELGGFEEALDEAKRSIGLDPAAPVTVDRYPKPKSLWHAALGGRHGARAAMRDGGIVESVAQVPEWARMLARDRVWALLPFDFRIR